MGTTYTLSGDFSDLLGDEVDTGKISAYVRTNLPAGTALIDTTATADSIRLGNGKITVAADGTWSITLLGTANTGLNVAANTLRYEVVAEYVDRASRGRATWRSGFFELTANSDLKTLATAVEPIAAVSASGYALEAKGYRDEAAAITGLTGEDAAIANRINTPGSLTDQALKATIATATADKADTAELVTAIQSGTLSPVGLLAFSTTGLTSISSLRPYSVGADGRVYGRSGAGLTVSRLNPTSTGLDGFLDFSTKAVHSGGVGAIRWATKTEAGYVVVTSVGGTTNKTYTWFSTTWTIAGFGATPLATIDALANDPLGIPNPAQTPDGKTVLIIAPWYGSGGVHNPIPWGSFDGGATWAALTNPRSTAGTGPSNNHWHAALYHRQWERLWLSGGDGVNSYFGYSDDKGLTWHNSPTPTDSPLYDGKTYQQPTMLVGFDDRIAAGPDRGTFPPGVWKIDPITGKTVRQYSVDPTVATADMQYPLYPHAQAGNVAYIAYPASSSMPAGTRDHTDIIATGDGGRSWHNVGRIAWAGVSTMASNGILGPDPNGYLYMAGPTGLMRAPVLDWVPA